REQGQISTGDPQVRAQGREDTKKTQKRAEDTPLREDRRLHTGVKCRLRDNAADTKERGRRQRECVAETNAHGRGPDRNPLFAPGSPRLRTPEPAPRRAGALGRARLFRALVQSASQSLGSR